MGKGRRCEQGGGLAPEFPLRLAKARLSRPRPPFGGAALGCGDTLFMRQAQFLGLERANFIAQAASFLKFEVSGGSTHLLFQFFDIGAEVMTDEVVGAFGIDFDQDPIPAGGVGDDIVDVTLDRGWGDAVQFVVSALLFTATVGFAHRAFHAAGDPVGIEDNASVDIAGGATDRLNQ